MTLGLIDRRPGELPAEVTSFVGRRRELGTLDRLLRSARLWPVPVPGRPRSGFRRSVLALPGPCYQSALLQSALASRSVLASPAPVPPGRGPA